MSWKLKLAIVVIATLLVVFIVEKLEGNYTAEARLFLRNFLRHML